MTRASSSTMEDSEPETESAPDAGKDPLAIMVAHSERPHYVHGPSFLVSPTQSLPTRETMIEGCMRIPCYTPYRDAEGKYVQGPPTFWSREKAERSADAFFADYAKWEARVAATITNAPAGGTSATALSPVQATAGRVPSTDVAA